MTLLKKMGSFIARIAMPKKRLRNNVFGKKKKEKKLKKFIVKKLKFFENYRSMIPHLSVSMPNFSHSSNNKPNTPMQPPLPSHSSTPVLRFEEEIKKKEEIKKEEARKEEIRKEEARKEEIKREEARKEELKSKEEQQLMNAKPKHSGSFVSYFKKENEESPLKQRGTINVPPVSSSTNLEPPTSRLNSSSSPSRVTVAFGKPPQLSNTTNYPHPISARDTSNLPSQSPSYSVPQRALSPPPVRRVPKFCIECGTSLVDGNCPSCLPKPKFCIQCGSALSQTGTCLTCSKPKKFCVKCGNRLVNGFCPNNC